MELIEQQFGRRRRAGDETRIHARLVVDGLVELQLQNAGVPVSVAQKESSVSIDFVAMVTLATYVNLVPSGRQR